MHIPPPRSAHGFHEKAGMPPAWQCRASSSPCPRLHVLQLLFPPLRSVSGSPPPQQQGTTRQRVATTGGTPPSKAADSCTQGQPASLGWGETPAGPPRLHAKAKLARFASLPSLPCLSARRLRLTGPEGLASFASPAAKSPGKRATRRKALARLPPPLPPCKEIPSSPPLPLSSSRQSSANLAKYIHRECIYFLAKKKRGRRSGGVYLRPVHPRPRRQPPPRLAARTNPCLPPPPLFCSLFLTSRIGTPLRKGGGGKQGERERRGKKRINWLAAGSPPPVRTRAPAPAIAFPKQRQLCTSSRQAKAPPPPHLIPGSSFAGPTGLGSGGGGRPRP